jgi:glycosyltransferase involved in cell wall biosynthesis
MRIGIDVRKIKDFGIGIYIQNLVKNLLLLDQENEYVLFFHPQDINDFAFPSARVRKAINRSGKYSLGEHFTLSWQSRRRGIDLFFSPHYVMPLFLNCKKVVTIHDLIHLKFPEFFPRPGAQWYAKFMFQQTVKRAGKIIADSENTKKDICQMLGAEPVRIEVIYPAVDEEFSRFQDGGKVREFRNRHRIGKGYLLYVGSERPHKNLKNTILAFSRVADKIDLNLVIRGPDPRKNERLRRTFRELKLQDRITLLDFIPKEELPLLYAGADLLVFPSLYEGFGFPVLEAFSCGTPVVTSNCSSIPEVAGDAAFLVDPLDVGAIAEGIFAVLHSPDLRSALIEKGKRRAELFSWKTCAEKTLEVFGDVVGGNR